MTNNKADREAMVDETLIQTYPASDSPSWTLGVESSEAGTAPSKGGTYLRRHAVLQLLSDEEVARVSNAETAAQLADGEDYIDLARPERGALRASPSTAVTVAEVLPRSAVSEQTWAKVLLAVHQGWAEPER
ncbi:MAG: hypothetical protein ABW061_26090 [Polyangiaceae bacterium]